MRQHRGGRIGPVGQQFLLGQRLRPGGEAAGGSMPRASLADAMLHAGHLRRVPLTDEDVEDAAVPGEVTVEIAATFPWADRRQVRRLQRGYLPLVDRVVGNAQEPDLPRAPRLRGSPLDALVVVSRFPR